MRLRLALCVVGCLHVFFAAHQGFAQQNEAPQPSSGEQDAEQDSRFVPEPMRREDLFLDPLLEGGSESAPLQRDSGSEADDSPDRRIESELPAPLPEDILPFGPAYSLQQALRDALARDPRPIQAEAQTLAAAERTRQAQSIFLPVITGSGSYSEIERARPGELEGRQSLLRLTISQNLFSFGRGRNAVNAADAEHQASFEDARALRQLVLIETIRAYIRVLLAEEVYALNRAHEQTSRTLLETARDRYEADIIQITDFRLVRSLYNQAVSERTQANINRRNSRNELGRLTGNGNGALDFEGTQQLIADLPQSIDEALAVAQFASPELLAANLRTEAAQHAAKRARAELFPDISLVVENDFSTITDHQDEEIENSGSQISLQFNSPLFQGGVLRSARRESLFNLRQARQSEQFVLDSQQRLIRDVWNQHQITQESHASMRLALDAERKAIEGLEQQSEEGIIPIWRVLDARRNSLQVLIAESQLRYAIELYKFELHYVTGRLESALLDSQSPASESNANDNADDNANENAVSDQTDQR